MELPPKQARFVSEYLVDLNATQAAIRAGYSPRTANEQGARLLAKASVAAAVADGQRAREVRTGVTADRVLRELARIAFGDVRALFDEAGKLRQPHELEADVAATLAGIEVSREKTRISGNEVQETTVEESVVKVKSWDKVRALELLAKHLGMLSDRVKLEGEGLTFTLDIGATRYVGDSHL